MAIAEPKEVERYSHVAMIFHWTIAALIGSNLVLGFLFHQIAENSRGGVLLAHRSLGLAILFLTILRIIWRVWRKPPMLGAHLHPTERALAHVAHAALYALMLALPLSGWIMVSADAPPRPVPLWLLTFPPFPFPPLAESVMRAIHNGTAPIHRRLAWTMIALAGLHLSGAFKHQWIDRDGELGRMIPLSFDRRNPK